ncbi:ABC transporter permease [Tunicatimonas pelagia]|uniref:ABC transporter permease n=1 Tax=Tunicatimonas pelagia TaxID=931531 RepID=UPI0026667A92|nr:ABC transporter permease [Tunicatimonas pelagia]WKN42174.1 ABC transporter permease [Tunicatimonas pelagia]
MLKNYLITAYRNSLKNKLYAGINVLGLAIGITCCLFIALYVQYEQSYDQFHEKKDRIYKVYRTTNQGSYQEIGPTSPPYAEALLNDFPEEIAATVRVMPRSGLITAGEKAFTGDDISFVGRDFLQVFTFPLLQGDPATALSEPGSVVLTKAMAQKYFGNKDPIGKELEYENEYPLLVTGVLAPVPENSHIEFDFLASVHLFEQEEWFTGWWNNNMMTYLLASEGVSEAALEEQFPAFMEKYMGEDFERLGLRLGLTLSPLTEIYFANNVQFDMWTKHGNRTMTYIFLVVAVFILLIACINFMNLATARAARRATEVGVRKSLGANRSDLIYQFFGESFLTTFVAVLFTIVLMTTTLPIFNQFAEINLTLSLTDGIAFPILLLGIALVVGLLAGSYPAMFLSAFVPAKALKGGNRVGAKGQYLRKGLVVFQFVISIVLMVAVLVVVQQMNYVQDKQLGFNKERVMLLEVDNEEIYEQRETFKDQLRQHARIAQVSAASGEPGGFHDMYTFDVQGKEEQVIMNTLFTDENYLETMGLTLLAGRNFSEDRQTDAQEAIIINETAARTLEWTPEEALGKEITNPFSDTIPRRVVGVVEDYHFASLHNEIDPLAIMIGDDNRIIAIKMTSGSVKPVVGLVEEAWAGIVSQHPFAFTFLDESYDQLYQNEQKQGQIFTVFAGIAIFIACLGLFGLVTFVAEQRTKEVGVRKVLGASVLQLIHLLTKDFAVLVIIALVIASPIAYYAMHQWLADFAYRVTLRPTVFVVAGAAALLIALLTVSYQSARAALANPADSLRNE